MAGVIDDYVTTLAAALRGPRRTRRDMLTEVRDGLIDAAEALEAAGLSRSQAERAAVAEFGSVEEVAPEYQEELVANQGRRLAVLLFLGFPLITLIWSVVWRIFPAGLSVSSVPWWFLPLAWVMDIVQILLGLAGGAALIALRRGARGARGRARARRLIRILGLAVWAHFPFTVAVSAALLSEGQVNPAVYLPVLIAGAISVTVTIWQLCSAARCLALAREGGLRERVWG